MNLIQCGKLGLQQGFIDFVASCTHAMHFTKEGRNSQYPICGPTTGRIAALLLACVARQTV